MEYKKNKKTFNNSDTYLKNYQNYLEKIIMKENDEKKGFEQLTHFSLAHLGNIKL